jgi:hypothetical protein
MCKELRALGAVMVADGDMVAKFSPVTAALVHQQGVSGVPMTDKDKPMTPEQAREAMRRRELGL